MRPNIVFVVMSAVTPPQTVDQLARALAPHRVLVHHDFTQTPDFPLASPNVVFVPEPKRTGWASFGFVDGIFHTLAWASEHLEFDYLQLLSPTCLPIKPMAQFEAHVSGAEDAHFDCIDLLADPECLMSVGYRAFTPAGTLRHRALRRLCPTYFGDAPGRRDEAGVWIHSGGGAGLRAKAAMLAVRAASSPMVGRHLFTEDFRPYYGSVWFGARARVVRGMVEGFQRPGVREYFSRLRISEEFLVPTLLMQHARHKGPLHHLIAPFNQAHPGRFEESDFEQLRSVSAFFARKFPEDPHSPLRLRVLEELVLHRDQPAAVLAPPAGDARPATAAIPDAAAWSDVQALPGRFASAK